MPKTESKDLDRYIIKELGKKSYFFWLKDVVFDWLIITSILIFAAWWDHILGYILTVIILGNRQHALGILGHEGTHYTLHQNRKVNDLLSDVLCFWILGLSTSGYRTMHLAHHAHTNTENDPEVMHKQIRPQEWALPLKFWEMLGYTLRDLIGHSINDYIMIVTHAKPAHNETYIYIGLTHFVFISSFALVGHLWVPVLWYFSLLTSFMMFFRLRLWLEHQGEKHTNRIHLGALEGAILAPHNIWYHYEHHAFPTVPYHRLKEVRSNMKKEPVISLSELFYYYLGAKSSTQQTSA